MDGTSEKERFGIEEEAGDMALGEKVIWEGALGENQQGLPEIVRANFQTPPSPGSPLISNFQPPHLHPTLVIQHLSGLNCQNRLIWSKSGTPERPK